MQRLLPHSCAAVLLSAAALAQNCSDNTYRIHLVDQYGTPVPATSTADPVYLPADERVYLAFDPQLPSGLYYVHVTDPIGGQDEVLSLNAPTDRFVLVTNSSGIIALSLPYGGSNDEPMFGSGLGGVGQSMPLFPFRSASWDPCRWRVWLGDTFAEPFDPNNPYLLRGGWDKDFDRCMVRSYESFRIGDGSGSDVTGLVFLDRDGNGVQDAAEPGVAGEGVRLVTATTSLATSTGADGTFRFEGVAAGPYTVEFTAAAGTQPTTPSTHPIEVCGCGDVAVAAFGRTEGARCHGCHAHTRHFWHNHHGRELIAAVNLLPSLAGLPLVDRYGQPVSFGSVDAFAAWNQGAGSTNAAHRLAIELATMVLNVAAGCVDLDCTIDDDDLGVRTVGELIAEASASLAHGHTPRGHAQRGPQDRLRRALYDANRNRNWLRDGDRGCDTGRHDHGNGHGTHHHGGKGCHQSHDCTQHR